MKMQSTIWGRPDAIDAVYGEGRRERIASLTELEPIAIDRDNMDQHLERMSRLEVIFGTWGMPSLSAAQLDALPRLRAVFYAAGSVQQFARPMIERGIEVHSGWLANATFVAHMTVSLVVLACKGYFQNVRDCADGVKRPEAFVGPGMLDATVAILGAGAIGRRVAEQLHPLGFHVLAFDPFLSDEDARALHIEKVTLDEAFARALVVSNHMANKPETAGLISGERLRSMPQRGALINTARPQAVDHDALVDVLQQRPDLTALLDVAENVAPNTKQRLRALPNAFVSSHIAGAINRERLAIGDAAISQFEQWRDRGAAEGRVTEDMLATMA